MPTLTQQKRIATPALRTVPMKGSAKIPSGGSTGSGGNKKGDPRAGEESVKPKRSHVRRWVAAGLILGAALLTVVFVANAIKVNELLAAIASVEEEHNGIRQENERLRAELLRLMSVEQVTQRATELGMIQPDAAPIALPLQGTKNPEAKEGGAQEQENREE